MDALTTPSGSIALAVSALLLVVGYRLARPDRAREWAAVVFYAGALAVQLLGARGLLGGPVLVASPALRIAGALLLVAGLLLAGKPSRARRRPALAGRPGRARGPFDPVYAGLGLILVGQLARAPTLAGAVATIAAVAVCTLVALARSPESR